MLSLRRSVPKNQLNIEMLKHYHTKQLLSIEINNNLASTDMQIPCVSNIWQSIKETLTTTAKNILGNRERKVK